MNETFSAALTRWREAGLLDEAQRQRILAHEAAREARGSGRLRLPAILAIAFGSLMVGAGVLLFVAAHWDRMGPDLRFALVLAQVALFHLAGAFLARRTPHLAIAFHGVGSLALGAGIFLAGQIFNLQEHWPGGVLLWALGAWLGVWLLRDWVQGTLAALLTPIWLAGEWIEAAKLDRGSMADGSEGILAVGLFLLATTYLTGRRPGDGPLGRALAWVGGLAFLPCVGFILGTTYEYGWHRPALPLGLAWLGWSLALALPLALAALWRGRTAWINLVAALWAVVLGLTAHTEWEVYAWCALGAAGLTLWGLAEGRRERVNLGVAGFALTLICFYFSSVMDKLGRSLGLMGLGLLFLVGGWQLERLRRKLTALIRQGASS